MSRNFTEENLLASFPAVLAQDKSLEALARVVATAFSKAFNDTDSLSIYTRIDTLSEKMCDRLAEDFDVKWYYYNGTLESKRNQIKNQFAVHRKLGTKQAIFDALEGLCDDIDLHEWDEYGGLPMHFRISLLPKSGFDFDRILYYMTVVKRESACLDKIQIYSDERVKLYQGIALLPCTTFSSEMNMNNLGLYAALTDEQGNILTDSDGAILIEQEDIDVFS